MGIFVGYGTNLPTQLWISARYLQSTSMLLAPFFLDRKLRPRLIFGIYLLICSVLFLSIFTWRIFPACYIEGQGLTTFKIVSEYIISFILLLSMIALARHKEKFDVGVLYLLMASIFTMIASEIAFTLYVSPYGPPNLIGHILMVFSFSFLYRALIDTGLSKPYRLLFRNLKQNEEALRESEAKYRALSEHLEEKVEEKVAELRLAQRLATIGQMVSVVAHEVRNPLQNINMGIDAVRNELAGKKETVEMLEEIDYGINSLNTIITELLDYSRPTSLSLSTWPLGALVKRALFGLSDKLQNITVHLDLQEADREIPVDAPKFIRVLVNLLSNATEAMMGKGTLWIKSNFSLHDSKQCLFLSITDDGPGIDEKNLERIFEPFFTTKTRGTGLGIPICKKIIEAHNGTLCFRNKSGHGTTAEIILPVE
jgi:signal transduction histidine kinase